MKKLLTFITMVILMLCAAALSENGDKPGELTTVEFVDLNRYAGLWYEIAKIPNRFQKNCDYGTTAQYALREDGKIEVINRCYKANGELKEAKGIAKIVDNETYSKLKVSFVSFLGWRPFWGDYWIIGLDPDYYFAIVGDPGRKYGWILCRDPEMNPQKLEEAYSILRQKGYDPDGFVKTVHN